jgi:SNF2 family DNA or RNA helicase
MYIVDSLNGSDGIILPALAAAEYFATRKGNSLVSIQWPEEFDAVCQAASQIRESLHTAHFVPDFSAWPRGNSGWAMLAAPESNSGDNLPPLPYFNDWLSMAVQAKIDEVPELREAWESLMLTYPPLASAPPSLSREMDETEWLVAIGFQEDPLPLRACLQLEEPADSPNFSLRVVLQDRHNPSILTPFTEKETGDIMALPPEYAGRVVRDAAHWKALVPWLAEPAGKKSRERDGSVGIRQTLSPNEAWRFFTEAVPVLAQAGYTILLPAWWEQARKTHAHLRATVKSASSSKSGSLFGLDQTVSFDWRIALGEAEITPDEFAQLVSEKSRLVQFRSQWLCIDPEFLRQIRKTMKTVDEKGLSFREVLERYLRGSSSGSLEASSDGTESGEEETTEDLDELEVELSGQLLEMVGQLETKEQLPMIQTPSTFHGELRPYQQKGFSWLLFLRRYGFGALLADDMGLGKTVQYIAYLLQVHSLQKSGEGAPEQVEADVRQGPALLVCPTSVLGNWQKELDRFAPELRVYLHYGTSRKHGEELWDAAQQVDLVVTSYAVALLDGEDLAVIHWDSLCLDEAQNIKNAQTKQAASVRRIPAAHRIAMTGTPVENRLTELWSLMDFVNPGYLGRAAAFSRRFVQPIEKNQTSPQTRQLQRLVKPFLLRRIKEDPAVELDLPEKSEMKEYVSLSAEQAALYESIVNHMLERIDHEPPMTRRGIILATLTRLKQTCNHPALALQDTPDEASRSMSDLAGQIARSAKLERLVEMVQEVREEGARCLIFTQFVQAGLLMQSCLQDSLKEAVPFLHGGLSKGARDRMITNFQDGGASSGVLLLSLKAGGVGLNLTAATHVFHFDRWWNPAVESQATDRAYRIGQERHVQVHKFVTLGTLEERIDALLESKLSLSQNIVSGDERWITELGTDELRELLMLRREWLRE